MKKVKIILPIHSAVAPHVSASGVMSAPDSARNTICKHFS